jgi:hypothetical protein
VPAQRPRSHPPRAPAPALLALRAGLRELGGKLDRNAPRALPVAPREAHDVRVEAVERRVVELGQPFADLFARRAFVRQPRERAELLRARRRTLGGHHHELIPRGEHLYRG